MPSEYTPIKNKMKLLGLLFYSLQLLWELKGEVIEVKSTEKSLYAETQSTFLSLCMHVCLGKPKVDAGNLLDLSSRRGFSNQELANNL